MHCKRPQYHALDCGFGLNKSTDDKSTFLFYRTISFQLFFSSSQKCNTINDFDEGVEFSIRFGGEGTWIPMVFSVNTDTTLSNNIRIGNHSNLEIRGYSVEIQTGTEFNYSTTVCCFDEQSIQLRWLQTSSFNNPDMPTEPKDTWSIDDVLVRYEPEGNVGGTILLEDSFDVEPLK